MSQVIANCFPDNGLFGLEPRDISLQASLLQAEEGANGQTDMVALRNSHPKTATFDAGTLLEALMVHFDLSAPQSI